MTPTLPPPGEWNSAVEHSHANPLHILGSYEDDDGSLHMECQHCPFDTAKPEAP